MRINKYISKSGYASRRRADELITLGEVRINGEIAYLGSEVLEGDIVTVSGEILNLVENYSYYILNKPRGIECSANPDVKDNVISFLNLDKRIYPVGRLDKDSRGLLILTDDGDLTNEITRPRNEHEKEYIVKVDKPISSEFIENMRNGVPILDTITRKCDVDVIDKRSFKIVLKQGLNRQIRRMCEYLGYRVIDLQRIRVINITLDNLKVGEFRQMTESELKLLKSIIYSKN